MIKKAQWKLALAARKTRSSQWLMWAVIFGLLIWWWLVVDRETVDEIAPEHLQTRSPPPPARPPVSPKKDDLKRIEGIGPKIQNLLQEVGITTFAQLASADLKELEAILRGARLYMTNPSTWPEQARLAAAGQWEALTELQAQLRGGRKL
jgi:predicted flap endonuclease-1-like 5' DNA nuclease